MAPAQALITERSAVNMRSRNARTGYQVVTRRVIIPQGVCGRNIKKSTLERVVKVWGINTGMWE